MTAPTAAPAVASAPSRPEHLPETFWDAEAGAPKWDALGGHLKELETFKTEASIKAATIPESPDKYDFKLPGDFKPPEGMDVQLKPDDPLVGAWREQAHKFGLGQDGFEAGIALYANHVLTQAKAENDMLTQAREGVTKALGPNGGQRLADINQFLDQRFGAGAAETFGNLGLTKQGVEIMERLISGSVGSGMGSFGQNGRSQNQPSLTERWFPSMKRST